MSLVKPLIAAMSLAVFSQAAVAANITVDGDNKGNLDLMAKGMYVATGKDNGFDPNYGTALYFKIKYTTPSWNGLTASAGYHTVGDMGLNNVTADDKVASGMYASPDQSMNGVLGDLSLKFKSEDVELFAGRMQYDSPLTTAAISTLPSFHQVIGAKFQVNPMLNFGVTQMSQMAFGARTFTEFGLIGEKTITGGTAVSPMNQQAEFIKIADTVNGGADNENGLFMASLSYQPTKATQVNLWNYRADNITSTMYLDAGQKYKLANKTAVKIDAQYLKQTDIGDLGMDIDYQMFGAKATYIAQGWKAYVAFNESFGDTEMLNAWGGDPAYTSSMFSRNAYREDVSAFKVGGMYKIAPKWSVMASYANYGQSQTSVGTLTPTTDACEGNMVVTWKQSKKAIYKLTYAKRSSEYDTMTTDRTQSHARLVGVWKF